MVNRKMKPTQALQVIRITARKAGYSVELVPRKGKGSHEVYRITNADGVTVGSFGLTRHPREMSWTVMRGIEDGLTHLFGEKWMEK